VPKFRTKKTRKNVVEIDYRSDAGTSVAEFIVDRPFIFYIYDQQSDIPVFVGRIIDPNGELELQ
jgi:serine protease inhibitor